MQRSPFQPEYFSLSLEKPDSYLYPPRFRGSEGRLRALNEIGVNFICLKRAKTL